MGSVGWSLSRQLLTLTATPGLNIAISSVLFIFVLHVPFSYLVGCQFSIHFQPPVSLHTFSSLLASGLRALSQTPKDQIKMKKQQQKRAKIFPFQMEEQMELLARQRISTDPLHQAWERQTVTTDREALKRPHFPTQHTVASSRFFSSEPCKIKSCFIQIIPSCNLPVLFFAFAHEVAKTTILEHCHSCHQSAFSSAYQ